jgi:hypothetical protein
VKKICTSQPSAAAVEARISGGYAMSSAPLVAMIAIFLVAMSHRRAVVRPS